MIEIIENAVQLAVLTICMVLSADYSYRKQNRESAILAMFYGSYVLGDLYWLLYLICYGYTPRVFYVAEMSWYAAYVFLHLFLLRLAPKEERKTVFLPAWLGPVFAAGMCAFFIYKWGDYFGNLMTAALMSLLIFNCIRGLYYTGKHPEEASRRRIYLIALAFCLLEYITWVVSGYDNLVNLYYCLDFLLTPCIVLLLPAFRKAVDA